MSFLPKRRRNVKPPLFSFRRGSSRDGVVYANQIRPGKVLRIVFRITAIFGPRTVPVYVFITLLRPPRCGQPPFDAISLGLWR